MLSPRDIKIVGKRVNRDGYWYRKIWGHPFCGKQGYIAEHRFVMEKHLNRFLNPIEVIHHINGNVKDNRIENLEVIDSPGKHAWLKHRGNPAYNRVRENRNCLFCNQVFNVVPSSDKKFCSHKCYVKKGIKNKGQFVKNFTPWNKGVTGYKLPRF